MAESVTVFYYNYTTITLSFKKSIVRVHCIFNFYIHVLDNRTHHYCDMFSITVILDVLKHIQGKLTILFLDWNGNTCPIFQTQVYILKSLIQSINTLKHLLSVLLTKHLPHSVTNIHVVYLQNQ